MLCSAGHADCLNDKPPTSVKPFPVLSHDTDGGTLTLPGNVYTVNQQCAHIFEPNSVRCPYLVRDSKLREMLVKQGKLVKRCTDDDEIDKENKKKQEMKLVECIQTSTFLRIPYWKAVNQNGKIKQDANSEGAE